MKTHYTDLELKLADELISNLWKNVNVNPVIYSTIINDMEFRGWITVQRYTNDQIIAISPSMRLVEKLKKGLFSTQYNNGLL
jgi:CRISPR/Cas system CMR subunit Cmr6 (Cas7 group RAMP superfamily)